MWFVIERVKADIDKDKKFFRLITFFVGYFMLSYKKITMQYRKMKGIFFKAYSIK